MPRRDRDDDIRDDFDDDPRRPRRRSNTPLLVGLLVGGGLLAIVVCGGLALTLTATRVNRQQAMAARVEAEEARAEAAKAGSRQTKPFTREAFKKLVMNKTTEEVKAVLGAPDATSEAGDTLYWDYEHATTDPDSGKLDLHARVIIRGGKVVGVDFYWDQGRVRK